MITSQHISKSTRQSETALRRGGWVAPGGPNPPAMLLRHAGADDELRHLIPAIAMIDAGAPWTYLAPKTPMRRSGAKSTVTGKSPVMVPLSLEWAIIEGVTSRRKKVNLGKRNPGNRADTALEVRVDLQIIGGHPGGMLRPSPDVKCRKETWTPSRALGPQGPSRISAACALRVGSRPSKCPGQRPGYAKFGIGTSTPTNKQHP